MRAITSDLAAVQLVRSPRARVACTVEARGQSVNAPAVAWTELVSNTGQVLFKNTTAVGLADGKVLRFIRDSSTTVIQQTINDPTSAANWTTPSATATVISGFGVNSIAALRIPGSSTIRLWYVRANGNVYYIESTNNGSSWGAAQTVYSGGNANHDMLVAYINTGVTPHKPWFFGFSAFSAGAYTPYFGFHDGAAWQAYAYTTGYRAAGMDLYGGASGAGHRVYVYREEDGVSRLRVLFLAHATGTYTLSGDIDSSQGGLFGLCLSYYKFCQLPQLGITMAIAGEHAQGAGAFMGVASSFYHTTPLVDEPVMLPALDCVHSSPPTWIAEAAAPGGLPSLYLVGDTVVYRGVPQAATADTLEPIAYIYDDHTLEIEFAATVADLYVGQILVLNRMLSWGSQSGSEPIRFYIVRVEKSTDKIRVRAVDAVGFLGIARTRRPSIVNDGTATGLATVMRRLVARFGLLLYADDSAQESAAVMPLTLQPAESLLGAAYRATSQSSAFLVPRNDGEFAVTLITPPNSDVSGDYVDAVTYNQYGQSGEPSGSQQPITKATQLADYRRLAFAYVLGTYSTDPEDGGALAMRAGPVIDNTRPLSYSLTNTRYNTADRVANAAQAEADRQMHLPITAILETHANLALEVYDLIEVTDSRMGWTNQQFRVRRTQEVYDRGRLTHTLYLGDV
jgi:hypothetical protein